MIDYPYTVEPNDPTRKGELAGRKYLFGHAARYAVAPLHTRWDAVTWFVWDVERHDERGFACIIRQADTCADATVGM